MCFQRQEGVKGGFFPGSLRGPSPVPRAGAAAAPMSPLRGDAGPSAGMAVPVGAAGIHPGLGTLCSPEAVQAEAPTLLYADSAQFGKPAAENSPCRFPPGRFCYQKPSFTSVHLFSSSQHHLGAGGRIKALFARCPLRTNLNPRTHECPRPAAGSTSGPPLLCPRSRREVTVPSGRHGSLATPRCRSPSVPALLYGVFSPREGSAQGGFARLRLSLPASRKEAQTRR